MRRLRDLRFLISRSLLQGHRPSTSKCISDDEACPGSSVTRSCDAGGVGEMPPFDGVVWDVDPWGLSMAVPLAFSPCCEVTLLSPPAVR